MFLIKTWNCRISGKKAQGCGVCLPLGSADPIQRGEENRLFPTQAVSAPRRNGIRKDESKSLKYMYVSRKSEKSPFAAGSTQTEMKKVHLYVSKQQSGPFWIIILFQSRFLSNYINFSRTNLVIYLVCLHCTAQNSR